MINNMMSQHRLKSICDDTILRHATEYSLHFLSFFTDCYVVIQLMSPFKVWLAFPGVGEDHHRQPGLCEDCGADGDEGKC